MMTISNIIIISYILILFTAGNIAQGVLYSDIFLPIFIILIIIFKNSIIKTIYYKYIIIILAFGLFSGIASFLLDLNDWFYIAVFLLRFLSFGILFCFGLIYCKKIADLSKYYLPIILISTILYSIDNYLNGYKEHYSYVTIISTWSPAASGFLLSSIGLYGLLISLQSNGDKSNYTFFSGMLITFLGLLTFTNSAFASLTGAIFFWFSLRFISKPTLLKIIVLLFFIISIFIFAQLILDFFWRVNWMLHNLEYRFNKASSISIEMCRSTWCIFFGSGPGSHSFINGNIYGKTSILAFDQLHTRIFLEWGILGSLLWAAFFLKISFIGLHKVSIPILVFVMFGVLFGIGSEFIFEAYSGQLYGLLLGSIVGCCNAQYGRGLK